MIYSILKRIRSRYSRMLDTYYPAFDTTGFTERNLTFNFCHEALCLNENLIVWQEAPFANKKEHLDSIIFDDDNKALYIIEAKRLGAKDAFGSIDHDMERLEGLLSSWKRIRGVDDDNEIVTKRNGYAKHLVILVDLWAEHDSTEDSVAASSKFINFKSITAKRGFDKIIGPYKVDGKTLDNQKYYLLCAVKTIDSSSENDIDFALNAKKREVCLKLGQLLHLCQCIEWKMKFMVEQASREIKFEPAELSNPSKFELKWISNTDTLGTVVKQYLNRFYGEQEDNVDDDDDLIHIRTRINFNGDVNENVRKENYTRREKELSELVSVRNNLAHQFGLKYPLQDLGNCGNAFSALDDAEKILKKHVEQIGSEFDWLRQMQQMNLGLLQIPELTEILNRQSHLNKMKGTIGKLKSYDFSKMATRTIFDYTDNQEFINMMVPEGQGPEYFESLPTETRLADLQCLADLSENRNFMEAVSKQQRKIGAVD